MRRTDNSGLHQSNLLKSISAIYVPKEFNRSTWRKVRATQLPWGCPPRGKFPLWVIPALSCKLESGWVAGVSASEHAAFVLVAGGLGERLGYSDIKLKLPVDSARGASFLQVLSYTALSSVTPPTSDLRTAVDRSGLRMPLTIHSATCFLCYCPIASSCRFCYASPGVCKN